MRLEVHSPDGLEAATRDELTDVEHVNGTWCLVTANGYGIIFLSADEMALLTSAAAAVTA